MREEFVIPYKSVTDNDRLGFSWSGRVWIDDKKYNVIAARNEDGWEHVSVSSAPGSKLPSWEVLLKIKDCFWDEDEDVIHWIPKKQEYVNIHPNCMHMWKIRNTDMGKMLNEIASGMW